MQFNNTFFVEYDGMWEYNSHRFADCDFKMFIL